ncbi:MAG: 8-amino-7-oxononanoate synthase [Gammaproteobacteria bacterium]|jgi:8-amino-7-oxononanoate synthase
MDLQADEFRGALDAKLKARKEDNLFRNRQTIDSRQGAAVKIKGRCLINFCSNDYLGLSNHPEIVSAFKAGADEYGVGSSASPMVSGRFDIHQQLEEKLAKKTGREAALIFPSGYMANLAVATSFAGRSDAVFLDRLAHASLVDAARLSAAKLHRYKHVDTAALSLALEKSTAKTKLVLTDTVFSMDGDIAPVRKIAEVCKQNHAVLVVDDAHGFGVLGKMGGGLLEEDNIQPDQAPVLVATFGKALGTAGAFVAADKLIIETLVQFGRSYIYTTAQPPALASATLAALEVLEKEPWRRQKLHELVKRFKLGAEALGLDLLPSDTAIQPLSIGSSENAIRISENLRKAGFLISAIRPPTVPEGTARLRITLTAAHTEDQIDRLLDSLGRAL